MLDRFFFWAWHTEISQRLRGNPLEFLWTARVEFVYKPLFKEKGWRAVKDEHVRYLEKLSTKVND